jgi:SnoaL-like domain
MTAGAEEGNVAIVRRLVEAADAADLEQVISGLLEGGDPDEVAARIGELGELSLKSLDPEIELDMRDHPGVFGGTFVLGDVFHGLEGWVRFWREWLEVWERYDFSYSNWEERGDNVLVDLEVNAVGRGSGIEIDWHQTQAWTVRDGRIVRLSVHPDRDSALAAIEPNSHS